MAADEVAKIKLTKLLEPESHLVVTFDFGRNQNEENNELTNQSNEITSMADAVNVSAAYGWRFVNSNLYKVDDNIVYYYYMVKGKR